MKRAKRSVIARVMIATTLCMGGTVATSTWASDDPPPYTEEGLRLLEDSRWGLVYVLPDADFTGYDSVQILETFVAFRENYRRDMNRSNRSIRITENDMNRIKDRLANEFDSVFRGVFEADEQWTVTEDAGENVLVLRPAIINLDVQAPDTMSAGRTRTYAETAGEMTLYLEVRDSVSGALLAKGLDRQGDRRSGFMDWQTRATNTQAARRILTGWAESLRDGLNEARESAIED